MREFVEQVVCSKGGWFVAVLAIFFYGSIVPVIGNEVEYVGRNIQFFTLKKGALLGDQPKQAVFEIVTDASQWQSFKDRLPVELVETGSKETKAGNFIVIAYSGAKGTSGYGVEVSRVTYEDMTVLVDVVESRPGSNVIVEPAMTLPYHIIVFSSHDIAPDASIRFRFLNVDSSKVK